MKFYHQLRYYPFIRLLFPYCTGIILAILFKLPIIVFSVLLVVNLIFLVLFRKKFKKYRYRWAFGVILHAIILSLGVIQVKILLNSSETLIIPVEKVAFRALVIDSPEVKERSVAVLLKIIRSTGSGIGLEEKKILARFEKNQKSESISAGDELLIHSKLKGFDEPRNPYELNYKRIMNFKGICLQTYINGECFWKTGSKNNLKVWAIRTRDSIIKIYSQIGVTGEELSVLSALTVGYRDNISDEINKAYASAGVVHILSVSGLHVGIIYLVLNSMLFFLKRIKYGNIANFILITLILWLFAFIAGLSPCVVRAALMFTLIQLGINLRKDSDIFNILAFSAFIILLINPLQITDIGFQLSYLAVAGIVLFQHRIYSLHVFSHYISDKIWMLLSVSISAQIITTPLTMLYFHQFPVYFWLANLFVIPMVAVITYLAVFAAICASINLVIPFLGNILIFFIKCMNLIISHIEKLPFSVVKNININFTEMMIVYAFISFFFLFLVNRKPIHLRISLAIVFVFLAANTIRTLPLTTQRKFIVFSTPKQSAFALLSGKNAIMFHTFNQADETAYYCLNYLIKNGVAGKTIYVNLNNKFDSLKYKFFSVQSFEENTLFAMQDFNGLWLKKPFYTIRPAEKIKLDCILLTGNIPVDMKTLTDYFKFDTLIAATSNKELSGDSKLHESDREAIKGIIRQNRKAIEIKM